MSFAGFGGAQLDTCSCNGKDIALRCLRRRAQRQPPEQITAIRKFQPNVASPDAALGDADTATRRPYQEQCPEPRVLARTRPVRAKTNLRRAFFHAEPISSGASRAADLRSTPCHAQTLQRRRILRRNGRTPPQLEPPFLRLRKLPTRGSAPAKLSCSS